MLKNTRTHNLQADGVMVRVSRERVEMHDLRLRSGSTGDRAPGRATGGLEQRWEASFYM